MLTNRLYYMMRPMIHRRLQIFLRRQNIRKKYLQYKDRWPVFCDKVNPPQSWKGWPDGKQFAFVMTHDIETKVGQERVLDLMKVERDLGFTSSFNFVPERYKVSTEIMEILIKNGFEVGVHDLKHDGKLYSSESAFLDSAVKINRFLKDWNSVGFRSGAMHHDLDLIHALDIEYDASTFDFDPFEPQPDGVETIFPFWVPPNDYGKGYVELPYTLPQDFTLFILMKEKNIDTWKKKLDWVAANGGMALLISHPDYMCMGSHPRRFEEYPIQYYSDLLMYIRETYKGRYLNVNPKEVALHISGNIERNGATREMHRKTTENRAMTPKRKMGGSEERLGMRACMVAYTFYENDNRVRRYAETLVNHGVEVDVIALQRGELPYHSVIDGVNVYRIQKRSIDEKGKFSYFYRLMKFLVRSSVKLGQMHLRKRYDVVHVHNVPDFEVFAAIIPKLTGAKIILDIHDILPEFYGSKFNKDDRSLSYKMVLWIEKLSAMFADHVIISNDLWVKYYTERAIDKDRCTVVLNYPDPRIFNHVPQGRKENSGKITMIYPGTLNWHQGVDIAVRAFAAIARKYTQATFLIYGDGPTRNSLIQLIQELGLEGRVIIEGVVPIDEISDVMSRADIGVVPKRANSFGNEAFSTKILEFMALGVPVIVSNTKIDKYYFSDDLVMFFENEDVDDLAAKMELMITNRDVREQYKTKSLEYIKGNNWDVKKRIYLDLISSLTGKKF